MGLNMPSIPYCAIPRNATLIYMDSSAAVQSALPEQVPEKETPKKPTPEVTPSVAPATITFELRNHRESLEGAMAMAQLLTSLPEPPHGFFQFLDNAPFVTFEFFSQGQTVYTFLTVPSNLASYISGQMRTVYPKVLLTTLAHNPLQEFSHPKAKSVATVRLKNKSHFPLRGMFPEGTDPLGTLLSPLTKLLPEESALIQVHLRKAKEGWKRAGLQTMAGEVPNPHSDMVKKKINQSGFDAEILLLSQASDKNRSNQLLADIMHSFATFTSESNTLIAQKPLFFEKTMQERIIWRRPAFGKTVLSLEEASLLVHLPNKLLSSLKNIAWGRHLLGEPPESLPTFTSIPESERDNVNLFGKTELKNQEQIFGMKQDDRRRHMYVLGKSGTGKSTLLANMIINDLKHDQGLCVIDPHGDLIETVLDYIPKHRINDVIYLDPSDPEAVVKINLFDSKTMVHRELISSGIVAIFQKMYANSWGPRLEYILRNTLLTLLSRNAKLEDVIKMLTNEKYRERVVEELDDEVLKNFWLKEFNMMPDRQRVEAISPILNKVGQFVTSPLVRHVVNAQHSSIDIEEIMDKGKILLINVSQGKLGEDNASLLGAMLITKIQLAAMNRVYKAESDRKDFYLYIDEFQNFATTSFIKILSEARKYRLNLVLANQYMDQIDPDVKNAIFGNAGTIVSFILGATDAAVMQQEFGNLYTQDELVSLSRYQIIIKLMIDGSVSRPFPATTLGLAASRNQNRAKVLRASREQYAKKKV